jgi:hypothetical protein
LGQFVDFTVQLAFADAGTDQPAFLDFLEEAPRLGLGRFVFA